MLKNNFQKTPTKLIFVSSSKKTLIKYINLLNDFFKNLNINYSLLHLPTSKKRITLLKSPHVNKKSKEHFEINLYKVQVGLTFFDNFLFKSIVANRPKSIKVKLIR